MYMKKLAAILLLISIVFSLPCALADGPHLNKNRSADKATATPAPTAVPAATPAPVKASAHDLQDPVSFFGDLLSNHDVSNLIGSINGEFVKIATCHSFTFFAEEHSDAFARLAAAYEDYLSKHTALQYSGSETNHGGWIYRWYTFENAADSDLFKFSNTNATGEWNRFFTSVVIMYSPAYSEINFYYALSFNLTDLNYRLDETEHAALSEIAAAYAAQRAAEEEAARKAEEAQRASASSSSSPSSSSSSSWTPSSSSSNQTRTTRCHSCGGDGRVSCSNCSGRGYKEKTVSTPNYSGKGAKYETVKENCYRCRGSGDVDCSSCGGDGEVEY